MKNYYFLSMALACGFTLTSARAAGLDLNGSWQLANSYVVMSTTDWAPGKAWYCDYGQTGCSAPPHGVPNGTYTAAIQTLNVNAGDVLIIDGTNSSTNNLYNGNANRANVTSWITCGTNADGMQNPPVSPYVEEDVYNYSGVYTGNHHMVYPLRGVCQASQAGSITVALLTLYAGPEQNGYGAMTLDGVGGSNFSTGMVVQQYSSNGMNVLELSSANASGKNYYLPITGWVAGDVAVSLDVPNIDKGDQIYVNAQSTATICGACFDEYDSSIHGGMDVTQYGSGNMLLLGYAGPNLSGYDLPLQSNGQFSMYTAGKAGTFSTWSNWNSGENGDIESQNQYTQIQALVFRSGSTGYKLSNVQYVPAPANWSQTTSTQNIAHATVELNGSGVVDAAAMAQVYEKIGTKGDFATCATYVTIYQNGAQVAQSLGNWWKFSAYYHDFPFESHELFSLNAGTYDVYAQLACSGYVTNYVSGEASGSGLFVSVYQ